jgi:hypothetical protein
MKNLLLTVFLLVSGYAYGQQFKGQKIDLTVEGHSVHTTLKKDSLSISEVQEFFAYTDQLFTGRIKHYDRYLYTPNAVYYRPGLGVFKKPTIYKKEGDTFKRVRL